MEEIKIRVWDKEENRMISGDRFAFEEYAPLNDLFNNNKLTNLYFVLNGTDHTKRVYRKGYGKKYGIDSIGISV